MDTFCLDAVSVVYSSYEKLYQHSNEMLEVFDDIYKTVICAPKFVVMVMFIIFVVVVFVLIYVYYSVVVSS